MSYIDKFLSSDIIHSLKINFTGTKIAGASVKIVLIVIFSIILVKLLTILTEKLGNIIEKSNISTDERANLRAQTITGIINNAIIIFISIIAIMLILGELGINLAPIIAGAGVLGLAISFGAQNLVKDVITGFFILLEDQFGIGDIVKIDEHAGNVESMNLRTTILRDLSGNVHIIPNGEIKNVVVMTKSWARAVIDIKVYYKQDIGQVLNIITDESIKLANEWNDKIIETPEILGIDSIDPNGITIRVLIKTKPAMQWDVGRELRKRVIERFNFIGIELPFFPSFNYQDVV